MEKEKEKRIVFVFSSLGRKLHKGHVIISHKMNTKLVLKQKKLLS